MSLPRVLVSAWLRSAKGWIGTDRTLSVEGGRPVSS